MRAHIGLAGLALSAVLVIPPTRGLQPADVAVADNLVPAFSEDLPQGTWRISGEQVQCTIRASDPRREGQSIKGDGIVPRTDALRAAGCYRVFVDTAWRYQLARK